MSMIPLLIAAVGILGGFFIVSYWSDIVKWLEKFLPEVKRLWSQVRSFVPHEARIFGDKIIENAETIIRIMHKMFYKEDGKWYEKTTTRQISEDEVPADIRNRIGRQTNITPEIERELSLTVN